MNAFSSLVKLVINSFRLVYKRQRLCRCYSPESLAGSDVYADDVFAGCRPNSSSTGAGRTALLVISAVLVAVIVAVAVFCLCRRRSRQRRRPNLRLAESSNQYHISRTHSAGDGNSAKDWATFSYRHMVDMERTTDDGHVAVHDTI